MDKDRLIFMRNTAKNRAKNRCELCGNTTLLIVRTNHCFLYSDYLRTGEIMQRELSVVCETCSKRMVTQEKGNTGNLVNYICVAPSGVLLEYQV